MAFGMPISKWSELRQGFFGIGAETGLQALMLAAAAGATTALSGTFMLLAFVAGLVYHTERARR